MKTIQNDDIRLLIELSCISSENKRLFEQFHRMLVALAYDATDVCIDYSGKRIYMNVVAEDCKGDFLRKVDNLMPTKICMNLTYDDLEDFLKDGIKGKNAIPSRYYSLLKAQFFKAKPLFEKDRTLEEV